MSDMLIPLSAQKLSGERIILNRARQTMSVNLCLSMSKAGFPLETPTVATHTQA
jgi:hypothetical protein